jgi:hypothetical protein
MEDYTAATSAMYARHPPKPEMSRAPRSAAGSARKPLTSRPLASRIVPIDRGGGIAATNLPKLAAERAQISA